jgi:hypothetical protein
VKNAQTGQNTGAKTMELLAIILIGAILLGIETWLHFRRVQTYKNLTDQAEAASIAIAQLEEGKKYIVSIPETLSDSEFEEAVAVMDRNLDLMGSNIHLVIVQGNVTLVEFS